MFARDSNQSASARPPVRATWWILASILLLAFALRLGGVFHDLPFSYYGDELHFMKRAVVLGTGDLNPHWFHKPAALMYVLLFAYGLYFLGGTAVGRFESVDHFAAHFLTDHGPFLLIGRMIVLLSGVALVYAVYRLGRRLSKETEVAVVGALLVAVSPALVRSSQEIKADVPCALLIALSLLFYLYDLDRGGKGWKYLVLAALVAGMAMGTKYYGIILLPAFGLWELRRSFRDEIPWRQALGRILVLVVLFVVGFFVVSPYNFLDPTWSRDVVRKVTIGMGLSEGFAIFEIDSKMEYLPGIRAWLGAAVDLLKRLVGQPSMGLPLAAVFLLGLLASLSSRRLSGHWLVVGLPVVFFIAFSAVLAPYHAQTRHLNAVLPLLGLFAWPASMAIAGVIVSSERRQRFVAITIVLLVVLVSFAQAVQGNRAIMRTDSRTVAYEWVIDNLGPRDRLLVEDDGPSLRPNRFAIARLEKRLEGSLKGPFVLQARQQLELFKEFEPEEGRNLDLLARPWWLAREKSDEKLARSAIDARMGNPIISRAPRSLRSYRDDGIRYIVATSVGASWLSDFEDPEMRFPSFVRFYDALERLEPIATIDPAEWNGKGPVIWIYDLTQLGRPPPASASPPGRSPSRDETERQATGSRREGAP